MATSGASTSPISRRLYIATLDRRAPVFGAAVRLLGDAERLPLLVHCSAGKDRTGLLVALVLSVLGTPRELVVSDYTLTGRNRPNRIADYEEALRPTGVDPEQVRTLFETPAARWSRRSSTSMPPTAARRRCSSVRAA